MNEQYVKNVIEAALLAAGRPLSLDELAALFDERDGSAVEGVQGALAALRTEYETRGLELAEVASGYRIQIRAAVAEPVSRLWTERPAKYSRALLETLALVAYRQPITRGEIEQIRGVAVNPNIVKTMLERNWIRVVGHRDVPGRPELLGTTREFLDYFGLKKLDDLPTLAQLKELEDLRVQLALPGAEPVEATAAALPANSDALEDTIEAENEALDEEPAASEDAEVRDRAEPATTTVLKRWTRTNAAEVWSRAVRSNRRNADAAATAAQQRFGTARPAVGAAQRGLRPACQSWIACIAREARRVAER